MLVIVCAELEDVWVFEGMLSVTSGRRLDV
jgi:hypothetical protein